jgi:galactokinase
MELGFNGKKVGGVDNATAVMGSGDHLTVAYKNVDGKLRLVTIAVQGSVMVITAEHTQDSLVLRHQGVQFIEDKRTS